MNTIRWSADDYLARTKDVPPVQHSPSDRVVVSRLAELRMRKGPIPGEPVPERLVSRFFVSRQGVWWQGGHGISPVVIGRRGNILLGIYFYEAVERDKIRVRYAPPGVELDVMHYAGKLFGRAYIEGAYPSMRRAVEYYRDTSS